MDIFKRKIQLLFSLDTQIEYNGLERQNEGKSFNGELVYNFYFHNVNLDYMSQAMLSPACFQLDLYFHLSLQ